MLITLEFTLQTTYEKRIMSHITLRSVKNTEFHNTYSTVIEREVKEQSKIGSGVKYEAAH